MFQKRGRKKKLVSNIGPDKKMGFKYRTRKENGSQILDRKSGSSTKGKYEHLAFTYMFIAFSNEEQHLTINIQLIGASENPV